MNTPSITARVADLIRNPNSAMPSEWERSAKNKGKESSYNVKTESSNQKKETNNVKVEVNGAQSETLSSGDTLTLTPLALKIMDESDSKSPNDWEKARNEKVQRVQQLVQDEQYTLSPEMVDSLAQKIVSIFSRTTAD